ncbi:hypothetical protein PFISCL1PPCAC_801, partial [Pristionchus fissidentatus]
ERARRWKSASDLREVKKKKKEEEEERVKRGRKQEWIPAVTEPRPFTMSTREPIRARYSEKFVERMIEKRRREEEERKKEEEKQMKYRFHAGAVPESTYQTTNPLVKREEYVEAVRTRNQQRMARWKSKSSEELYVPRFRPVPLSTYIPPKSYSASRSKSAHERALRMLTEASTPPGLKEHEARSHVRSSLRHRPCTGDFVGHTVPASVPNFKELHRKMEEKLGDAVYRPPTVPVPFHLTTGNSRKTHDKDLKEKKEEKPAQHRINFKTSPSPVRKTQASDMRERAIREKLELRTSEVLRTEERKREERDRFLRNAHRLKALVGERRNVEDEIRIKAEQKRRDLVERERDYERSLREMRDRVEDRPLVVERQTIISSQQALQKRFDQVMKSVEQPTIVVDPIEKRDSEESDYAEDFEAESTSSSSSSSSSRRNEVVATVASSSSSSSSVSSASSSSSSSTPKRS